MNGTMESLRNSMRSCEQAKGQTVLEHGESVLEYFG